MTDMQALVIIPARLKATRLPNKPLLPIGNLPMLGHCWQQACKAEIGEVFIAAGDEKIAIEMQALGAQVILTDQDLPSGSDRIWQAFERQKAVSPDIANVQAIVNMQGDLPFINPKILKDTLETLIASNSDVATPVVRITSSHERDAPQVVKAVCGLNQDENEHLQEHKTARALYFSRNAVPSGIGNYYHHIGIYAWKVDALERFVNLEQSPLEKREKLEQLRALEAGMHIEVVEVEDTVIGIDTPDDLEKARLFWQNQC